ncbi:acetate/propionate family kinase [Variovorax sp. J22P271]|uniref:acetate/propionate family kinase n=1 Tax=Variovorax davisae TaxID=3053515 RepID=UPI002578EEEA|nr:acetate/propionate family kinase [Variovorax sp. J22P271]MDM0033721.1 acetate/propionate family kinase [Variovorax sp. J22P271]
MTDAIVVLNAGSSSLKFSVFAGGDALPFVVGGQVSGLYTAAPRFVAKDAGGNAIAEKHWDAGAKLDHHGAIAHIVEWLRATYGHAHHLSAVGHRVVHGGMDFAAPVRVDGEVVTRLEKLIPLAPLHQPHNLAPMRALLEHAPGLPQVACFDTAMHRSNPALAQMFALPKALSDAGVRRYGFHGLSYEYIASVLPRFDERAARGKTVVLHLGNGASMCALDAGRSVASTMGFTAVDGLPMGTRCGALDPGVILYLMDEHGMDTRAVEKLIYSQSGLLGVSGVSSDMRELLASEQPQARMAVDLFVYRIGRELGSLAAALGGLDAIVFTAGIGERASAVRERICAQAAWLGIALDPDANAGGGPRISTPDSRTAAWVIPTNEELMIARHTRDLLA